MMVVVVVVAWCVYGQSHVMRWSQPPASLWPFEGIRTALITSRCKVARSDFILRALLMLEFRSEPDIAAALCSIVSMCLSASLIACWAAAAAEPFRFLGVRGLANSLIALLICFVHSMYASSSAILGGGEERGDGGLFLEGSPNVSVRKAFLERDPSYGILLVI